MKKFIIFLILIYSVTENVSANGGDTILYVNSIYKHEIYNGRNTARKYAIKQEMRDFEGVLFREVFYDEISKQVDHTLYYYYNSNKTIRLIECVDINEKLTSYSKYFYKKNMLIKIENYSYNDQTGVSQLISTKKYTYKKGTAEYQLLNYSNGCTIESSKSNYKNGLEVSSYVINNISDTAHIKIYEREYDKNKLVFEREWTITASNDTNYLYRKYIYNSNNNFDTIYTYNINHEQISFKVYTCLPGGSVSNIRTIGKNDFYFENLTYDYRKYYRELPRKKSLF